MPRFRPEEAMKTALALLLFLLAASAFGQNASVSAAESACGPVGDQFTVKISPDDPHTAVQPEPGKALVYVVEDQKFKTVRDVTARAGVDGAWVGANRGNSYLFFSVEAGEHHLCTDWLSDYLPHGRLVSLNGFTAEAGKIYYFRVRTSSSPSGNADNSATLDLDLVNSDEGKLMVASTSLSVSQPKKK
jgi:hypothetical protein